MAYIPFSAFLKFLGCISFERTAGEKIYENSQFFLNSCNKNIYSSCILEFQQLPVFKITSIDTHTTNLFVFKFCFFVTVWN